MEPGLHPQPGLYFFEPSPGRCGAALVSRARSGIVDILVMSMGPDTRKVERWGRCSRVMMLVTAVATAPSSTLAASSASSSESVVPAEPPPAEPAAPTEPVAPAEPPPAEPSSSEPTAAEANGWGPEPATNVPVTPPPIAIVPAALPPPPPDPELSRRRKTASGVAVGGAVLLGVGGAAWLLLAAPAALAAAVATDRAEKDPLLVSESELHARAERRRRFATIAFLAGAAGVVPGGVMLGVGLGTKARIEREMSRPRASLGVRPMLSLHGAGAAVVLRH